MSFPCLHLVTCAFYHLPSPQEANVQSHRERISIIWATLSYVNIAENSQEPQETICPPAPAHSQGCHVYPASVYHLNTRATDLPRDAFFKGVLEDGLSSNGVPRSTAPGGISNPEKRMSCGTQCPNPQSLTSGPLTQKQNGLRTTEAKRDAKRMSAKEVTINVTDSIRQADRSRRISKNCVN
ncbi:brain and acute leukemia cytoplasmic protein isoform X1 [Felis catus]|uniref:brain and acute leukemia cytoplasmic protein isoform X1 n=1 Tax=Felis catus TaxID=9685 RepID=UPI001D19DED8|nr:brain and acute leukemia cytoplasmic protein isoform X1 [Felis catus]